MELLKNRKKTVMISAVLLAVILIGGAVISANAAMPVNSYVTDLGPIEQITELNGTIKSNKAVTCYSDIDGIIGKIYVKEGDYVHKGDLLMAYDEEDMNYLIELARLESEYEQSDYNKSLEQGNRYSGLYYGAAKSISELDAQIAVTQVTLTQKQNELLERKAALADEGAKLQISLIDWSDKPDSDEYENLSKLVQTNAYEQQYGSDVVSLQEEINALTTMLTGFKETRAEMVSQKASSMAGVLTQSGKDELEARRASNELSAGKRLADLNKAKEGIKAEFDGIVTGISVVEGSNTTPGMELIKLESSEDVIVAVNVNKYDIVNMTEGQLASVRVGGKAYTGKVKRIERMTSRDSASSGVNVEVSLDEPDSELILGLEVKTKVTTASMEAARRIPIDALDTDEEGDHVYVLNGKQARKLDIETGVKDDEYVEIISGLNEGDVVVWNDSSELNDGMNIKVS